ncbi:MAG: Gfo/Idh/MocA family oxidoreductase [Phycisphaerae bacterium]|nr:Gfo/Idh/MocA family oxidoreductase [Phycisphaerae bacterium]
MADPIRIGMIGCGGNARGHMNALRGLEAARIVAVCDLKEDLANQMAEGVVGEEGDGLRPDVYADPRRLLERDDLDAVWISVPVFCHGELELDVIDRGLPFLVEKPVARTMEIARQVESAVEAKGVMTCVGYQLRYMSGAQAAKAELDGKRVNLAAGQYWSGSGRGYKNAWPLQMDKSGGQLCEQATHTFDMMRYLIGEVATVSCRAASRVLHEIDCPDVTVTTLEFECGALGSMTTTWAFDPADWSEANVLHILYDDKLLQWRTDKATLRACCETKALEAAGCGIDEVFVEAIRTGDRSLVLSDYGDAVRTLAISLAANDSFADEGRVVDVSCY